VLEQGLSDRDSKELGAMIMKRIEIESGTGNES
jgi:hypothetical protein